MTERGRRALERESARLRIGPSVLTWDGQSLDVEIDEITAPIPSRLRGRVRLWPSAINPRDFALDAAGRHRWRPIAPIARVEAAFSHPRLHWSGTGYLDSNWGAEPLELAFRRWDWARAALRNGDAAMLYDVTARADLPPGAALALRFDPRGGLELSPPPPRVALPASRIWRIPRGTQSEDGAPARLLKTLEDTPFYARSLVESRRCGEPVTCMHESLCLERFSSTLVRLMLPFRMPRRAV